VNRRPEHLTEREKQILRCVRRWIAEHGEGRRSGRSPAPSVQQRVVGRTPPRQPRKAARCPGPRRTRLAHLPPGAVTVGAPPSRGRVINVGVDVPPMFWGAVQFRKDSPRLKGQWIEHEAANQK